MVAIRRWRRLEFAFVELSNVNRTCPDHANLADSSHADEIHVDIERNETGKSANRIHSIKEDGAVVLRKQWLFAGLVCSLSTSSIAFSDGPNSPVIESNGLRPAGATPVLLSPPTSIRPIQPAPGEPGGATPEVKTAEVPIERTTKLTPIGPLDTMPGDPKLKTPPGDEAGFVSLLDGDGLTGWVVHEGRSDSWTRHGDVISCQGGGGGWLRTERQFSDFHFKFSYRLAEGCNSGIGIRCPSSGNPTFTGLELQLLDDQAEKYRQLRPDQYTGSLYYQVAPIKQPKLAAQDAWNQCEIICRGDQITVIINDEIVNDVHLTRTAPTDGDKQPARLKLSQRPPIGHLALQSHSSKVEFKDLQLKDLAIPTDSGVEFVDVVEGDGEVLTDARKISINYVGQLLDGTRFGDTRDFGGPVTVPFEAVIDGWKHGMVGMKVGGTRRLIVPPEQAYGSEGVKNLIPGGATLVFEVELCGFER